MLLTRIRSLKSVLGGQNRGPSRMLDGSGSRREASGGQRDLVAWESLLERLGR